MHAVRGSGDSQMRWLSFLVAIAFAAVAIAGEPDDKAMSIPLKDIWAFQMPGTKDVTKLEVAGKVIKGDADLPLTSEIRASVVRAAGGPGRGFAVLGTGSEALQDAHKVLTGK